MKRKQYVVFGAGKFGESVAVTLEELGYEVMVVDRDPEIIQDLAPRVSYAVCANLDEQDAFENLGLSAMDGAVIAFTEDLGASIVTAMMCHEAGIPDIFAKAKSETHEKILKAVGVHRVIHPEVEMGKRIAKYIVADNFLDWIDLSPEYSLVEMEIPRSWRGKTPRELRLREIYQINIIGFKQGETINVSIDPSAPLPQEGIVIVVGENASIERISK